MYSFVMVLVISACMFFASGCSVVEDRFEDGYQFGDITGSALDATAHVMERQQAYCAGADPASRALLLAFARSVEPDFPENGLCTDMFTLLVAPDGSAQ